VNYVISCLLPSTAQASGDNVDAATGSKSRWSSDGWAELTRGACVRSLFSEEFVLLTQQSENFVVLLAKAREHGHDQFRWGAFRKASHHALHPFEHPLTESGAESAPRLRREDLK